MQNSKQEKTDPKFKVISRWTNTKISVLILYIRIHYLHLVSEINTNITISSNQELNDIDRSPLDPDKNEQIIKIKEELRSHHLEIQRNGVFKHPSQIKDAYNGKIIPGLHFLSTFDNFIKQQQIEVKSGNLKKGTLKNYFTTQKYLHRFIKSEYSRKDIPMSMFDRRLLDKFLAWLVTNTESTNNGRNKHFQRIKRFVTVSINYGFIDRSPFLGFKIHTIKNPRMYLSETELDDVRNVKLTNNHLIITRDLFLFMANTGLAYSDLQSLDQEKIENTLDGVVIKGNRDKTGVSFLIPLSFEAESLLAKYSNHEIAIKKGMLLPVFCNQVFNRHLKAIGAKAQIDKPLTSHVARHTFATIALTSGVPLVTIQKVLGHADMRMTQHYSRLIDKKLIDDMKVFKSFMGDKTIPRNELVEKTEEKPVYRMRVVQ